MTEERSAGLDVAAELHRHLQEARDGVLSRLDGLGDYDIRRPLTPTGTPTSPAYSTPQTHSNPASPSSRKVTTAASSHISYNIKSPRQASPDDDPEPSADESRRVTPRHRRMSFAG